MFTERTSVGLDVHARSVAAAAIDGVTGEVFQARLSPGPDDVREWIGRLPGPVAVVYEAGPTGFDLSRSLNAAGLRCEVAAPSKIRRAGGDRVKTDRRDAMLLARLLRMDEVTAVAVPTPGREAARDLVRAREACRRDLARVRHQLNGLLLRHGQVYAGGNLWTLRHEQWLGTRRFEEALTQYAFDDLHASVLGCTARRDRLDEQIEAVANDPGSEFNAVVRRLKCLRGVATLTAFALAVEIGEWDRFTGQTIGAFVGLTPSEDSSGERRSRGSITKAGNTHARRLLIEAAWHHRKPYRPSKDLNRRWAAASVPAAARGDAGNRRLHRRWAHFDNRGKKPTIANTAIARELAGWCWSLAVMNDHMND